LKLERFVETWGTVIVVQVASSTLGEDKLGLAVDKVEEFFHKIDKDFSTYKSDSEVSRIRRGELDILDASDDVKEVWRLCENARVLTLGAFDPWKVEGGFDPSGLVKGWAADVAAKMLVNAGVESVLINAAGDLVLRGGQPSEGDEVKPWNVGISSPEDVNQIVKTFDVFDGSVATSGDYEKGAHIVDSHTGLIAIGAHSASVVGPDGALCDALATALMVDGRDAQGWMGRPELAEYSFWVINRDDETAWSYGPNKGYLVRQDRRVATTGGLSSADLEREAKALELSSLTQIEAIEIGSIAQAIGLERKLPIAVEVRMKEWIVFHASLPGSTPENDWWIGRKARAVNLTGRSTLHERVLAEEQGIDWHKSKGVEDELYAIHGGGLALNVVGLGLTGVLIVSGLEQVADHMLGVEIITEYLARKGEQL
jgi:FAD:protein FMN transferase